MAEVDRYGDPVQGGHRTPGPIVAQQPAERSPQHQKDADLGDRQRDSRQRGRVEVGASLTGNADRTHRIAGEQNKGGQDRDPVADERGADPAAGA
ncbi:hypothetical protein DMB66_06070 [Actinoplanes sp. ATCC 53533]|nr:hypothetical protein DMB66_06070 [Actinoplanes sp. ATCC 53533]